MGVPKVLENTLKTLTDDNILRSWSIFNEKNGNITLKIRYEAMPESVNRDQPAFTGHSAGYRAKSLRQSDRDRRRSLQWQSARRADAPIQHGPANASDLATPSHPDISPRDTSSDRRITRSQACLTVEQVRSGCDPSPVSGSILSPDADPFISSATRDNHSLVHVSPGSSLATPPCNSELSSDVLLSREPVLCFPDIDTPVLSTVPGTDSDESSDSGSELVTGEEVSVTGCSNTKCLYFAGPDFFPRDQDVFKCMACFGVYKDIYVCSKCLAEGGHATHRAYLHLDIPGNV